MNASASALLPQEIGADSPMRWTPDDEFVQGLYSGSIRLAPDGFGKMRRVRSIFGSGVDCHGARFVCCYLELHDRCSISESYKAGRVHSTTRRGDA